MTQTDEPCGAILHHYDASPFSEKVRLVLGLKNLTWESVVISNIMPRPHLMPLTGGYRRTPVLQIGADVFCDSQIIVRELERRFAEPTAFPGATAGTSWLLSRWSDQAFFQATVAVIFGSLPEGALPQAFLDDREQLSGRQFDMQAMQAAAPLMLSQWHAHADWVETQLADQKALGHSWLLGDEPSYGDITAYMNFWFVQSMHPGGEGLLEEYSLVRDWMARVAGLGQGTRLEIDAEEALERGSNAVPEGSPENAPESQKAEGVGHVAVGQQVQVMPDDYGRVAVTGELIRASAQQLSVRRTDEAAGDVVVHFPRVGFLLSPL